MSLGPAPRELTYCFERVEGKSCPDKAIARGLCRRHYQRRYNKGLLPKREKKLKPTPLTVRLPREMYSALRKQERATGHSLNTLIERAVSTQLQMFGLWPPK